MRKKRSFSADDGGEKPVMLLGRGYNEQIWIKGVLQIASDAKLQIVEGPFWDAGAGGAGADLPDWYFDPYRRVCRTSRLVHLPCPRGGRRSRRDMETAAITVAQEARLLNCRMPWCPPGRAADTKASGWICCPQGGGDDARAMVLLASNEPLNRKPTKI